jgi:predicted RNase H-like nuclease
VRTLPEAQALGVRIALQTLNILDKVFAVDDVMTPAVQRHVFEAHPELAFTALNGGQPMRLSKRRSAGRRERRAVLDAAGIAVPETPRGAKEDDVLDATALTWVARRIARGEAVCLPDPPPLDSRGLHMGIWT